MDYINKAVDRLDKLAEGIPKLVKFCKNNDVRPDHAPGAAEALIAIVRTIL